MSAAKKKDKGPLSQIASNLLVRSRASEESSLDINRLRREIIKEIESKNEICRQFRGLVESLRCVIPEEEKRYLAAIKTLSTTFGLSQEDVLKAADRQLTELKTLKEELISALPDWRDDLKVMESKSLEIRNEISKLREKIIQLETEQQEILDGMAVREKEMELAEKGMEDLLEDIAAEIIDIRRKIGESTAERVSSRSIKPPHSTNSKSGMEESNSASERDFREVSARQEIEGGKKCSVCGGQMHLYLKEKMWKCFVCAHEEAENIEVTDIQEKIENPSESATTQAHKPADVPPPTFSIPPEFSHAPRRSAVSTKVCPVCKKKMDWQEIEKSWLCPSCKYQRMEF